MKFEWSCCQRQRKNKESHFHLKLTRRVHKVKVNKVVDSKLLQLKHNAAQVTAKNFRVSLFLQLLNKSLFGIKTESFARPRPPSASSALLGRSFADWRHKKRFDSDPRVVDFLFGKSRVDDIDDTVNGKRGFGNVGRNDDFTSRRARTSSRSRSILKDTLLSRWCQGRVKRDHFEFSDVFALLHELIALEANFSAGVLDFLFTRQEQQNITGFFAGVNLENGTNGGFQIVPFRFRGVVNFHREGTTRNSLGKKVEKRLAHWEAEDETSMAFFFTHEKRSVVKVFLELASVEGGRHDNKSEILSLRTNLETHLVPILVPINSTDRALRFNSPP